MTSHSETEPNLPECQDVKDEFQRSSQNVTGPSRWTRLAGYALATWPVNGGEGAFRAPPPSKRQRRCSMKSRPGSHIIPNLHARHRWKGFIFDFLSAAICMKSCFTGALCVRTLAHVCVCVLTPPLYRTQILGLCLSSLSGLTAEEPLGINSRAGYSCKC